MNFGRGIFFAFVFFATFIGSLVYVCVRQDISLVSKNYYQDELRHQSKIDQIQNARQLEAQPVITFTEGAITIDYQDWQSIHQGKLTVLRPSDPDLDESFDIVGGREPRQTFPLKKWRSGLYRVSLQWTTDSKEYYVEKVLIL